MILHCETLSYRGQGLSKDFTRGTHSFSNLPPPPSPHNSKFDRLDVIILCLLRRQAWVKITCSRFIPSRLLSARIFKYTIQDSNENRLSDVAEKSLLFWKATFECPKNKQSGILRKILQRIKNAIEAIYDCRRCCFNFNTFFFNYTLIWFYPISFFYFYPPLFQVYICVPCVQAATPLSGDTWRLRPNWKEYFVGFYSLIWG